MRILIAFLSLIFRLFLSTNICDCFNVIIDTLFIVVIILIFRLFFISRFDEASNILSREEARSEELRDQIFSAKERVKAELGLGFSFSSKLDGMNTCNCCK